MTAAGVANLSTPAPIKKFVLTSCPPHTIYNLERAFKRLEGNLHTWIWQQIKHTNQKDDKDCFFRWNIFVICPISSIKICPWQYPLLYIFRHYDRIDLVFLSLISKKFGLSPKKKNAAEINIKSILLKIITCLTHEQNKKIKGWLQSIAKQKPAGE